MFWFFIFFKSLHVWQHTKYVRNQTLPERNKLARKMLLFFLCTLTIWLLSGSEMGSPTDQCGLFLLRHAGRGRWGREGERDCVGGAPEQEPCALFLGVFGGKGGEEVRTGGRWWSKHILFLLPVWKLLLLLLLPLSMLLWVTSPFLRLTVIGRMLVSLRDREREKERRKIREREKERETFVVPLTCRCWFLFTDNVNLFV